jgi:hypothetical protein
MSTVRIGSTIALLSALAVAGCGPPEGVARVAAPAESAAAEVGPGTPAKKARTRASADTPKTQTSAAP